MNSCNGWYVLSHFTAGGKSFGISVYLLSQSYEDAYKLYQIAKPALWKYLLKMESKLLYSVTWPASGFYGNKKMESIEDFKRCKNKNLW